MRCAPASTCYSFDGPCVFGARAVIAVAAIGRDSSCSVSPARRTATMSGCAAKMGGLAAALLRAKCHPSYRTPWSTCRCRPGGQTVWIAFSVRLPLICYFGARKFRAAHFCTLF